MSALGTPSSPDLDALRTTWSRGDGLDDTCLAEFEAAALALGGADVLVLPASRGGDGLLHVLGCTGRDHPVAPHTPALLRSSPIHGCVAGARSGVHRAGWEHWDELLALLTEHAVLLAASVRSLDDAFDGDALRRVADLAQCCEEITSLSLTSDHLSHREALASLRAHASQARLLLADRLRGLPDTLGVGALPESVDDPVWVSLSTRVTPRLLFPPDVALRLLGWSAPAGWVARAPRAATPSLGPLVEVHEVESEVVRDLALALWTEGSFEAALRAARDCLAETAAHETDAHEPSAPANL